jgi:hypothetical protein
VDDSRHPVSEALPDDSLQALAEAPALPSRMALSDVPTSDVRLMLSEAHRAALRELQVLLRQNGITAEVEEIHHGILEALSARPLLCRGLLAAYFLDV